MKKKVRVKKKKRVVERVMDFSLEKMNKSKGVKFDLKMVYDILERHSEGETITDICKESGMPSRHTIGFWRRTNADFDAALKIAQESCADVKIEKSLAEVNKATPKEAKLVDVKFKATAWYVSKICRSKYGEDYNIKVSHTIDVYPLLQAARKRMKEVIDGRSVLTTATVSIGRGNASDED